MKLFPFLSLLLTIALTGCGKVAVSSSSVPSSVGASSAQTLSATNLPEEYQRQIAGLNRQTKEYGWKTMLVMKQLLEQCEPAVREQELQRLTQGPLREPKTDFDATLIGAFIDRLLEQGDTAVLERLLINNCPEGVEMSLATSKHPDTVALLGSAYFAAGQNSTKQTLLQGLQRAFPTLKKPGQADDDFVRNCTLWLEANRSHLVVDNEYPYFPSGPMRTSIHSLFVADDLPPLPDEGARVRIVYP